MVKRRQKVTWQRYSPVLVGIGLFLVPVFYRPSVKSSNPVEQADVSRDSVSADSVAERVDAGQAIADPEIIKLVALHAFMRGVVYTAEGTNGNQAGLSPYKVGFGFREIQSFKDHPRVSSRFGDGKSTNAAGVCQYMDFRWDELKSSYKNIWYGDDQNFGPKNQDLGCAILFARRGGYKPLIKGLYIDRGKLKVKREAFNAAVWAVCGEWASIPCSDGKGAYDSARWGWQKARSIDALWSSFNTALESLQKTKDGADLKFRLP